MEYGGELRKGKKEKKKTFSNNSILNWFSLPHLHTLGNNTSSFVNTRAQKSLFYTNQLKHSSQDIVTLQSSHLCTYGEGMTHEEDPKHLDSPKYPRISASVTNILSPKVLHCTAKYKNILLKVHFIKKNNKSVSP